MKLKNKILFSKIYATIFGVIFGLFIGLLVLNTIARISLSIVFQWGDSAPTWGVWLSIIITFSLTTISILVCCKISNNWINSYLISKGYINNMKK